MRIDKLFVLASSFAKMSGEDLDFGGDEIILSCQAPDLECSEYLSLADYSWREDVALELLNNSATTY